MLAPVLVTLLFVQLPPGYRPHPSLDPHSAELVRVAREGNREALRSIRTLSCRLEREVVSESTPGAAANVEHLAWSIEYWRDGQDFRIRSIRGRNEQITDDVYQSGTS